MSNLEPIDEKDMDLKNKFIGGSTESKEGSKEPKSFADAEKIKDLGFFGEKTEKTEERSVEKEKAYSKILSKVKTTKTSQDNSEESVKSDAGEVAGLETAEAKIDKLIKIAMIKGVVHAVKVARHMDDNYTLDEFHDRLMAENFHKALVEKGMIKDI